MKSIFVIASIALLNITAGTAVNTQLPVVPAPKEYVCGDGTFVFTQQTTYGVENKAQLNIVAGFITLFETSAGYIPAVLVGNKNADVILRTDSTLTHEAYKLKITRDKITIAASDDAGFFYAFQTLKQLLPPAKQGCSSSGESIYEIPAMEINDSPRFGYRGLMLDVSRFFIPKKDILKIIDAASLLKINKLHLHLVDDNGWRIEIKKYPKLTQVGAWRAERDEIFPDRRNSQPGESVPVGGYYTQDDIKEMIKYAAVRQIEIIPEIEMPAHTVSSLAAYPQLACPVVTDYIGVLPGAGGKATRTVYCAGNDSVFSFLEDVLDEVIELFPSRYIHLGGDEASKEYWSKCPKCQKRMADEKIEHVEELQSYFMTRMSNYVKSKGREVIGWDELTNSTLPDDVIIFGWQGYGDAALKAAAQGHRFVMTPARVLYLIRYQGPQWFEPLTYFGNNTLKNVYDYEPVQDDWKPEYEQLLMGVQASMWTEFCTTPEDVEYMVFPRLLALADVAWTPKGEKNWSAFLPRMDNALSHIKAMGITSAGSMYNIDHKVMPADGNLTVTLTCIRPDVTIRYTDDGTEPTAKSSEYTHPLTVKKAQTIKAATFQDNKQKGKTLVLEIQKNKATGQTVTSASNNGTLGVLTNGLRGSLRHTDFEWTGWYDQNAEFTLDLGRRTEIKNITIGSITNYGMAVHKPKTIRLYISSDNKDFEQIAEEDYTPEEIFVDTTAVENIIFDKLKAKARYLKVEFESPGKCPAGHLKEDQGVWVYFDEIIVK